MVYPTLQCLCKLRTELVWVLCLSDRTLSILHLFSLPSDLEDSPVKYGTNRLSHLLHEKRVGASPPWLTSTSWPSMLITTCQTSTADVLLSWCVCVCVCVKVLIIPPTFSLRTRKMVLSVTVDVRSSRYQARPSTPSPPPPHQHHKETCTPHYSTV